MADQRPKTIEHIEEVQRQIRTICEDLYYRGKVHDASKLESPEREIFDEYTPKLKDTTYGSDEYKQYLMGMKSTLDHHYANNRHHPEHFKNGICGMNLIDLIEMVCDWRSAMKRHKSHDVRKNLEISRKRFLLSNQLYCIIDNTVKLLEESDGEYKKQKI